MKQYFTNLDPLRFVAIFCIFIVHFFFKIPYEDGLVWGISLHHITFNIGETGFTFFCVLSGFLNAYLIMSEMGRKHGQLDVRKFYMRRILRIWPLYFTFLFFAFVILPYLNERYFHLPLEIPSIGPFLFFLVNFNISEIQDHMLPIYSNLWTISLEEQFYLFLPWVLLLFKGRHHWLYALLLSTFLISNYLLFPDFERFFFHTLCLTSDFCIGIFLARQAIDDTKFFQWFKQTSRILKSLPYLLVLLMFGFSHFSNLIYSPEQSLPLYLAEKVLLGLALGFIILDQCFSEKAFFRLASFKPLVYLGQISFGLYIFHDLGIALGIELVSYLLPLLSISTSFAQSTALTMVFAMLITIAIGIFSYQLFEIHFLKLKAKFY